MIYPAPAVPADASELMLREEDAAEVSAGWRVMTAAELLTNGGVAFRDQEGNLLGLFGITVTDITASPWLLCSPLIEHHRADVFRRCRRMVRVLRQNMGDRLVYNYIPKAATANRRFVQALGFVILPSPRDGFDLFFLPCVKQ